VNGVHPVRAQRHSVATDMLPSLQRAGRAMRKAGLGNKHIRHPLYFNPFTHQLYFA
jgi:hypothetical protein